MSKHYVSQQHVFYDIKKTYLRRTSRNDTTVQCYSLRFPTAHSQVIRRTRAVTPDGSTVRSVVSSVNMDPATYHPEATATSPRRWRSGLLLTNVHLAECILQSSTGPPNQLAQGCWRQVLWDPHRRRLLRKNPGHQLCFMRFLCCCQCDIPVLRKLLEYVHHGIAPVFRVWAPLLRRPRPMSSAGHRRGWAVRISLFLFAVDAFWDCRACRPTGNLNKYCKRAVLNKINSQHW